MYKLAIGITGLMFLFSPFLLPQATGDLMNMELEDILDMNITVFSMQGLTQRETPGVVTLISEEEIRRSGARDLTDVLRLVPGFELGVDIQSAVSLGIRGIWAQEGKVLLMVDGMEMNEILYSCLALGDHFPVEQIQKIEIIRGPGTSFYGSNAELAVIHIITKNAVDLNGIEATASLGRSVNQADRRYLNLNFGKKTGAFRLKALARYGKSIRSDRDYTDIYGNRIAMRDHSEIKPLFIRAGFEYGGLKSDILIDRYLYGQQDGLDKVLERPVNVSFNTMSTRLKYDIQLSGNHTLTPSILYLRQEPWKSADQTALETDFFYHEIAERIKPSLVYKGILTDDLPVISGMELIFDQARVSDDTPPDQYFSDDQTRISNQRFAVYSQVFYTRGKTIPSLGIRYDRHNICGDAFLPWIGISHSIGSWTFKGLFGQTFRAPALENLDINPELLPEKTTTGEFEIGYQIKKNWICLIDLYRTYIDGPIVYYYDNESEEELYGNYGNIGSRGIEIESRTKWDSGFLNASFSLYQPMETIDSYSVTGHEDLFLGFPAMKFAFSGSACIGRGFSISPSFIYTSTKYGYVSLDADENYVTGEFGPALMANLFINHERPFSLPLEAGLGIYNIFNENNPILQPYDSGHAPLPILSREIVFRLRYHRKW